MTSFEAEFLFSLEMLKPRLKRCDDKECNFDGGIWMKDEKFSPYQNTE